MPDLTGAYRRWRYEGGAPLSKPAAEKLIENRGLGYYRLSGVILLHHGGVAVEITGRQREILPIEAPDQTSLSAVGPKPEFTLREMDLAFADAAAASMRTGIFGYR